MSQNSEYIKVLEHLGIKPEKDLYFVEGKRVRVTNKEYLEEANKLQAIHGIAIFKKNKAINPSSSIVFVFGHKTRKRTKLTLEELCEFLEKVEIEKEGERGYVFIEFEGKVVALGFRKDNKLKCLMSKQNRAKILEALKLKHLQK